MHFGSMLGQACLVDAAFDQDRVPFVQGRSSHSSHAESMRVRYPVDGSRYSANLKRSRTLPFGDMRFVKSACGL